MKNGFSHNHNLSHYLVFQKYLHYAIVVKIAFRDID